ncbi:MAG: hypothetical protein Q9201_000092 [Fulgogasparrea decipioides]
MIVTHRVGTITFGPLRPSKEENAMAERTPIDTRDQAPEIDTEEALHHPDDMLHPMIVIGHLEMNMEEGTATLARGTMDQDRPEMNSGVTTPTDTIAPGHRMVIDVAMWTEIMETIDHLGTAAGVGAEAEVLLDETVHHISEGRQVGR